MSYHISLFKNESSHNVVTANPVCNGDTYFIQAAGERIPGKNVLIETGNWSTYDAAFPHANFIYVGSNAYCFWDDGESQIKGSSELQKGARIDMYKGPKCDLRLTIKSNGTIHFEPVG